MRSHVFEVRGVFGIALLLLLAVARNAPAQAEKAWDAAYDGPAHNHDTPRALAVDPEGNVYLTGRSQTGKQFHRPFGVGPEADFATVKFDPNGRRLWEARYAAPGDSPVDDEAVGLALDGENNVHVTGRTGAGLEADFLTITYDANGQTLWERTWGTDEFNDEPSAIVTDPDGTTVVTGQSTISSSGGSVFATVMYDGSGDVLWDARNLVPHGAAASARAVAIASAGDVYVFGGVIYSGDLGNYRLIKYDTAGQELWFKDHLGIDTTWSRPMGLTIDSQGPLVTGAMGLPSFQGSLTETVQYDLEGNELWAATHQTDLASYDAAMAARVDPTGDVYLVGRTCQGNSCEILVVKHDGVGNEIWAKAFQGEGQDATGLAGGFALELDNLGFAYIAGASANASGAMEVATLKIDANGGKVWSMTWSGSGGVYGRGLAIALDREGSVLVAAESTADNGFFDYAAIKYSQRSASTFSRGDANDDGKRDLADAVSILLSLFAGGPAPGCADSADVNGDAKIDLTDSVYLLGYLFQGAAPPPAPFPDCGTNALGNGLGCASFKACK